MYDGRAVARKSTSGVGARADSRYPAVDFCFSRKRIAGREGKGGEEEGENRKEAKTERECQRYPGRSREIPGFRVVVASQPRQGEAPTLRFNAATTKATAMTMATSRTEKLEERREMKFDAGKRE